MEVYTLWASLKGEEPGPWMVAAEDENAWIADPNRCEAVFKAARELADRNGWDVREITLLVEDAAVYRSFAPVRIDVEAAPS